MDIKIDPGIPIIIINNLKKLHDQEITKKDKNTLYCLYISTNIFCVTKEFLFDENNIIKKELEGLKLYVNNNRNEFNNDIIWIKRLENNKIFFCDHIDIIKKLIKEKYEIPIKFKDDINKEKNKTTGGLGSFNLEVANIDINHYRFHPVDMSNFILFSYKELFIELLNRSKESFVKYKKNIIGKIWRTKLYTYKIIKETFDTSNNITPSNFLKNYIQPHDVNRNRVNVNVMQVVNSAFGGMESFDNASFRSNLRFIRRAISFGSDENDVKFLFKYLFKSDLNPGDVNDPDFNFALPNSYYNNLTNDQYWPGFQNNENNRVNFLIGDVIVHKVLFLPNIDISSQYIPVTNKLIDDMAFDGVTIITNKIELQEFMFNNDIDIFLLEGGNSNFLNYSLRILNFYEACKNYQIDYYNIYNIRKSIYFSGNSAGAYNCSQSLFFTNYKYWIGGGGDFPGTLSVKQFPKNIADMWGKKYSNTIYKTDTDRNGNVITKYFPGTSFGYIPSYLEFSNVESFAYSIFLNSIYQEGLGIYKGLIIPHCNETSVYESYINYLNHGYNLFFNDDKSNISKKLNTHRNDIGEMKFDNIHLLCEVELIFGGLILNTCIEEYIMNTKNNCYKFPVTHDVIYNFDNRDLFLNSWKQKILRNRLTDVNNIYFLTPPLDYRNNLHEKVSNDLNYKICDSIPLNTLTENVILTNYNAIDPNPRFNNFDNNIPVGNPLSNNSGRTASLSNNSGRTASLNNNSDRTASLNNNNSERTDEEERQEERQEEVDSDELNMVAQINNQEEVDPHAVVNNLIDNNALLANIGNDPLMINIYQNVLLNVDELMERLD